MHVKVRLFATLRDRAGTDQIDMELAQPANVKVFLDRLAQKFPALNPLLSTTLVAINHEYAFPEDTLNDGDEIALFPPVSGGGIDDAWPEHFAITQDALDIDAIVTHITRPETGAIYVFLGAVRGITMQDDQQLSTDHLIYEAYEPMASQKLRQIATEIREQYPKVQGIALVQRIGKLKTGQTTVLVACSAGHRNDGCLDAARYGIDRLKEIVPVWKKEVSPDVSVWVEGHYHPTPDDVTPQSRPQIEHQTFFTLECPECGAQHTWAPQLIHCSCATPLEIAAIPSFDKRLIDQQDRSFWRYHKLLIPSEAERVTLGEGWTPLITVMALERAIHLKLENLNPTGSFKDRGASALISLLKTQGIANVHDDSSGNAGAALAAYAARAGLAAHLFVPGTTSAHKLAQIRLYGAQLTSVTGSRDATDQAAMEASKDGVSTYASHIYNPFCILAYKSIAYELWEQLGYRAPDVVIMPLGHGTQLLGVAQGFQDLERAGATDRSPKLIGVQARICAPLWNLLHNNSLSTQAADIPTIAEGIGIANPVRGKQVIKAIVASKGDIITVSEEEIWGGIQELAQHGILAEPTSATVWPALKQVAASLLKEDIVVLSITGSGLKVPDLQYFADNLPLG